MNGKTETPTESMMHALIESHKATVETGEIERQTDLNEGTGTPCLDCGGAGQCVIEQRSDGFETDHLTPRTGRHKKRGPYRFRNVDVTEACQQVLLDADAHLPLR